MYKFRIKEEKYKSGKSKFYPQISTDDDYWNSISCDILGFNDNGTDWCTTLEDSQKLIDRFRMKIESNDADKIVEEKIHEVS